MKTTDPFKCFVSGRKFFNNVLVESNSKLPFWSPATKLENPDKIQQIICDHKQRVLVLTGNNGLELYAKGKKVRKFTIKNETIKNIQCGLFSFLVLTKSGKVWSLGKAKPSKEIPLEDFQNSTMDSLRHVPFFTEKNLFVEKIIMGSITNYFLCSGGVLYGSGYGKQGRLGSKVTVNQQLPIYLMDKVQRVFSGGFSWLFMYLTNNNKLFAGGHNSQNQASLSVNTKYVTKPQEVKLPNIKTSDILDIQIGQAHSLLLTKDGLLFGAGASDSNGVRVNKATFTQIKELQNHKIVKISVALSHNLVLTSTNELFGWGFANNTKPQNLTINELPQKINIPNLQSKNSISIYCSASISFIFNPCNSSTITGDFKKFFERQQFTDTQFPYGIKTHKLLVETRTRCEINQIQKFFEGKTKEEINSFLKWVYYDELFNHEIIKKFFSSLDIDFNPEEHTLQNDLLRLYNDEDSKDFNILVKEDDEDEYGNEDDDDDEEEVFEEIPAHKFVLLARSGLFREMFENVNEKEKKLNQIKDYSGKSIESLELLIKYLYTEKIELTADNDPVLVAEELEDAVEYYQLNENSTLINQLNN
ncbi:regulator of chromosome condensation [Anaeramoeba flamelloides]|uniref:Regulator of chromosome condensation n=1 Tax=Anaeramoeba flamelloides TaxID=1746091 RepID=A0ABQ8Y5V3_9EUKA|nr:regulator of chromosome condensation [Anaeramoeba flamelloides]